MLKNLRLSEIETIIKQAEAIETKHPPKRQLRFSDLESPVDPQDLKGLEAALEAIPQPARMEMLALIWIARGDYRTIFSRSLGVCAGALSLQRCALSRRQMGFSGNLSQGWPERDAC